MVSKKNIPEELMISAIDIAMGVVMISIARNPEKHKSFVDFLIIANLFHAGIVVLLAQNVYHIFIDALFIGLVEILPLILYP